MSHILLEEDNIILRAVEPYDLDFMYLAENDSQAWSASATVAPMSRYMIQQYIDMYRADIYQDRQLRLIVAHALTGEQIGIVDLYDFDPRNSRAGVGIYIAPTFRSQGYGKNSLKTLCRYAQEFIGIHTLYATIASDNKKSLHTFTRCSFSQVATIPDWIKTPKGYISAVMLVKIVANRS